MTPAPRPRGQGPADTVVYAIGDIHGRLDLLIALQARIAADAARRRARRRVMVHLGDYVDRGPHSQFVLEHLVAMKPHGFETIHLRGNHERMMLDFIDDPARARPWLANGGRATLASYGIPVADDAMGTRSRRCRNCAPTGSGSTPAPMRPAC